MDTIDTEKKTIRSKDQKEDGYTHAVCINRFCLRILGAWPDPYHENSWMSFIRFFFITSVMFLFATVSQTVKMTQHLNDLNIVTEIFVNCNVPTTIAAVKLVNIWYYRSVLKELVREIINDWESPHTEPELAIMWKFAKLSRFFTIGCFLMNKAVLITQFFMCFVAPISQVMKLDPNETVEWPLYMMGSFPYDVQKSPFYELTMTGQVLSNTFASTSFECADTFFVILMFHLTAQLSILKITLSELPKIESVNDKSELLNKFALLHARHNQLWRFSISVEESFNGMFLIQMVPCIFVLCTQGYQLIMITGSDKVSIMELIFMVYFLLLFLATIFAYCLIAEVLRQKSVEISHAAYNCDWTVLPPKEAKLLIFVILRAQHPFELTAGKFATFSLELYCSILKTSAGYLSMLLAVKDRMTE